eukprot:Em0004g146a
MCDSTALRIGALRRNRDQGIMSSGEPAMAYRQEDDVTGYRPCVYAQYNTAKVPSAEHLGYTLGKTLGSGTYAKVKAAWSPYLLQMVALKILNKKAASKDFLTRFLPREIRILQTVRHPNILRVHELIETERHAFFVLELAQNGDLLDYINGRKIIPEPEARFIFRQIASAVSYFHSINIIHRDLKCENVMLSKDMDIKIGDFGFALDLGECAAKTPCGSYSYAAPELFVSNGETYDGKKADVWSIGVILYAMVCGRLPFGDDTKVKSSSQRQLTFHRPLTIECREVLQAMLCLNPPERLSTHQLNQCAWALLDTVKPLAPANCLTTPKYTIENCLPVMQLLPPPKATPSNTHGSQRTAKPLGARIGAYGRRLADAVKQVGHNKTHPESHSNEAV